MHISKQFVLLALLAVVAMPMEAAHGGRRPSPVKPLTDAQKFEAEIQNGVATGAKKAREGAASLGSTLWWGFGHAAQYGYIFYQGTKKAVMLSGKAPVSLPRNFLVPIAAGTAGYQGLKWYGKQDEETQAKVLTGVKYTTVAATLATLVAASQG